MMIMSDASLSGLTPERAIELAVAAHRKRKKIFFRREKVVTELLHRSAKVSVEETESIASVPYDPMNSGLLALWKEPPPLMEGIRVQDIKCAVADYYGLRPVDLMVRLRCPNLVRPRQIGMFLTSTLTRHTLNEIARMFGVKDHTTVIHAVGKIAGLERVDPALAADIAAIKAEL